MATKPTSRQAMKSPEPELSAKESKPELKVPSTKEILNAAKIKYRTELLNTCQIGNRNPLTWSDLSLDTIQDLTNCPIQDLPGKVAAIYQLNDWESELKEAMLVSIYVGCLKFAKDSDFSPAQISAFFSIYKESIERSSKMELPEVLSYFRTMIISHGGSIGDEWDVFGTREAKLSIDYAFSTLFQHFRLYRHFLTQEQEVVDIANVKSFEVPVIEPLPLAEAMTKSEYLLETGRLNSASTEGSAVSDANGREIEEKDDQNISTDIEAEKEEIVQENPLDSLSPEEIQKITSDTINSLFSSVNQEYDALFEDQKTKFMNQISKFVSN